MSLSTRGRQAQGQGWRDGKARTQTKSENSELRGQERRDKKTREKRDRGMGTGARGGEGGRWLGIAEREGERIIYRRLPFIIMRLLFASSPRDMLANLIMEYGRRQYTRTLPQTQTCTHTELDTRPTAHTHTAQEGGRPEQVVSHYVVL